MTAPKDTAILLIDPYNDFLHPDGKVTARLADSLEKTGTISNLLRLLKEARQAGVPVFYGLHQQTNAHSYKGWQFMNHSMTGLGKNKIFEEGSWGAKFYEGTEPDLGNGDVVVSKHWNSSSFQNTDLDYQLRQRGIKKLAMAGLIANTCLESTARYAYELGFEVTMLSDATAGFTQEAKEAAVTLIWPLFANKVTTVDEWVSSLTKGSL